MTTKELKAYHLTTEQAEWVAAADGRIIEVRYKAMEDKKTGKKKDVPDNCFVAVPLLKLPTTGDAGLDSIILATMQGYEEDIVRELRIVAGNPKEMDLSPEDLTLEKVIQFASDKVSSLKLTETNLAAWYEQEGKQAVHASFCASNKLEPNENDKRQKDFIAAAGVIFGKLAAPVPDVSAGIAEHMLKHLEILGNECSPITQAVRRKLQQRVDAVAKAEDLAAKLGIAV